MKRKTGASVRGVFVTGTGTGVGKTLVGRALIAALRDRGVRVAPFKPVETGCRRSGTGAMVPEDAVALCRAAGLRIGRDVPMDRICPYRFPDPVAPHLAADRAGTRIDVPRIIAAFRELQERFRFVVAESAGGVLVPVHGRILNVDLMRSLGLPVLIVAPDQLGAINHTLLALEALRRRKLKVQGVVLTRQGPCDDASPDPWGHVSAIETYGRAPVLARFGRFSRIDRRALVKAGRTILSAMDSVF